MAKKLLVTVVVLMAFQDKFDHKTQYAPGTELQVDKERADDLVSRGLAEVKEETGAPPADNPETKQEDGSTGTEEQ
jgi:hypothetical protein|uniref:Thrombin inhibitor from mosquito n=1 Tax=Siphoviridae sp. ctu3K14 TaxID=2826500 RepID=A0A8S5N9Z3_9CAUD|nr:MAG TPA: Thrombin inhibitor from mosquito [Siphoviridae sp. ctu3K14]